jgi:hypothetical protein
MKEHQTFLIERVSSLCGKERRLTMAGHTTSAAASTTPGSTGGGGFVLSPEQEKVVNHRGGHLQVIACAGAGKTEAISRRVASLILDGVEPAQIIAFTFTDIVARTLRYLARWMLAQGFSRRVHPRSEGRIRVLSPIFSARPFFFRENCCQLRV